MKTTANYIDDLRAKLGVDSDFKAMNASRSTFLDYCQHHNIMLHIPSR